LIQSQSLELKVLSLLSRSNRLMLRKSSKLQDKLMQMIAIVINLLNLNLRYWIKKLLGKRRNKQLHSTLRLT